VSGTTGRITKFTASNAVGDSIMAESGAVITVTGTLNATSALQLNGTSINTGGTLSNVAYLDQANTFSSASGQTFAGGIGLSGGSPSTHGIMIPNAVPGVTTTNVYNDAGRLKFETTSMAYLTDKLSAFAATTSAELAGVISDETGSGSLVFATSPTLVTPNLGAATASTLTLTSTPLALPSGGVINWASGDVTITHSTNTLTFAGASSGYSFDASVAWGGGASISSSNNVALLDASNTFTGATQTIDSSGDATLALDSSATGASQIAHYRNGSYKWSVGAGAATDTADMQWYNRTNSATRMTLTEAGLLTVSGFGTHSFSAAGSSGPMTLSVANTTDGTDDYSRIQVTAAAQTLTIESFPASWTAGGTTDLPSSSRIYTTGSNGLAIAVDSPGALQLMSFSGDVILQSRGALALTLGASQAATFTGLLTVNGAGTSAFDATTTGTQAVRVRNLSNGSAARSSFYVGNDGSATRFTLDVYSSTFSAGAPQYADGVALVASGSGGMNLNASHASGDVRIYSRGTIAATFGASQAAGFTGAVSLEPTKKLYIDGGGDTYVYEDVANRWWFKAGGADTLWMNATTAEFGGTIDVRIAATKKLYLDGGGDTYIYEGLANYIYFVTNGGTKGPFIGSDGIYIGALNAENQIRDASWGSASTTLYIGNASINVTSDRRLKQDIVPSVLDATSALRSLAVVDYTWNDPSDVSYNNRNARGRWTGLIAQDTIDVLPFVVNAPRKELDLSIDYDSPSSWHIEYEHIVPVLVKGWQTHDNRIDALVAEMQKQQAEIDALNSRIQ